MTRSTVRRPARLLAVGALAATLALTACGSDPANATGPITAKLADYTITPSRDTGRPGNLTFDITNGSTATTHEFLVVKTDLDPADLPLDEDGAVDEKGEGLTFVDEKEDIEPGEATSLTVDLQPGRYVLLCNLEDHYAKGMYETFEVKP